MSQVPCDLFDWIDRGKVPLQLLYAVRSMLK
jgi:hypothetical protein